MRSIELRRERAKLIEDAGKILTAAHEAKRAMTAEEEQTFDRLHAEADVKQKQLEREERQEQHEAELNESMLERRDRTSNPERGATDRTFTRADVAGAYSRLQSRAAHCSSVRELRECVAEMSAEDRGAMAANREAFRSWLRGGRASMTEAELAVATFSTREINRDLELRAQTVTTTGGGYLIPQDFQLELDMTIKAYGGVRLACREVSTSTGAPMPWPNTNDTANTGELLAINTSIGSALDIAYGQTVFGAYKFSSKPILVPSELMQDSAFDVDSHVRQVMATRLGRVENVYLTTGTGSAQPNGIVTAAANSSVVLDLSDIATAANFANVVAKLMDLEHSVDPGYRSQPGAGFMFHDQMLKLFKKTIDANGRPIFRGGTEAPGGVDTIDGYPFTINQQMANGATAADKAVLFGALKEYVVRLVRPVVMFRLEELYRGSDQTGFVAFERLDGNVVYSTGTAADAAIKYAAMQA